jgi:hypothetical protein
MLMMERGKGGGCSVRSLQTMKEKVEEKKNGYVVVKYISTS